MNFPSNPLSTVSREQVQSSAHTLNHVVSQSIDSIHEITSINLEASKAVIDESISFFDKAINAKDINDFYGSVNSDLQPATRKVASFSRKVAKAGVSSQLQMSEVVHHRISDVTNQLSLLATDLSKIAPPGTEHFAVATSAGIATWYKALESVSEANCLLLARYCEYLDSFESASNQRPST